MSHSSGSDTESTSSGSSDESDGDRTLAELWMAEVMYEVAFGRSPSPPALRAPETPGSTSSATLSPEAGTPASSSSATLSPEAETPTSSSSDESTSPAAKTPTSTSPESTTPAPKTPTKSRAVKNPPCTSLSPPYPEPWAEKLWSPPSPPELPSLPLPSPVPISPEPLSEAPWWPVTPPAVRASRARTAPSSPPGPPPERLVIAIAGPTSSGKTTLSNLLLHVFGNGTAKPGSGLTSVALHQDDYLVPNNLPTGPQVEWVECYLEEWMGERLVTRKCMLKGFTVEEADRITPVHEDRLIQEYRDVIPRRYDAPIYNREVLSLQMRSGKNRDTRLIIDFGALAIAIARAKFSKLDSDMEIAERGKVKDYSFLLKKPGIDGPEIEVINDDPRDPSTPIKGDESTKGEEWVNEEASIQDGQSVKNNEPAKKEEPILEDEIIGVHKNSNIVTVRFNKPRWPPYKVDHGIYGPYLQDPTMAVLKEGKSGYIKNPIKANSLVPHRCFTYEPNSVQYPELPDGTRKLVPFIIKLRLEVQHWIEAMTKLNGDVGFPGLNFVEGNFRGIVFVEGFTILQPAKVDPAADPPNYDLSLFLSATREGTRKRRFARKEYNKPLMKGYMTWREKSYFDGVAWPQFVEEHQWIFNVTPEQAKEGLVPDAKNGNVSDLAKERGLEVRPGEMGVKDTLAWAMRKIMNEFGFKEMIARDEWVKEKDAKEKLAKEKDAMEKWVDEEYAWEKLVNEEYARGMLVDGNNHGAPVGESGELVQENLMDVDDIEMMFKMEIDKLNVTDAVYEECRDDGQGDNVDPYWGRHGPIGVEDEAVDPWWGMQHDNLVEEVFDMEDYEDLDWYGDDGIEGFGPSDSE
ncbi:hypothetical protein VE02_04246 [Pseudogymnoascus sp. 03VT05]|nr:hypothetical protein VE02_04246 [Pseudogymnoascus sp. 03VT05]